MHALADFDSKQINLQLEYVRWHIWW